MLKELRSQHRNIIQMSFNGFKNNEIAEKLGMSPGTISQILRSPLGKAYLNGLIDRAQENTIDVRKKLIDLNKSALSTIERILDPKIKAPYNVQLTAAKDVLDRNGYKPSDKFEIDVFSHKTDDEIEAEIRAMEAAVVRNQLIKGADDQDSPTLATGVDCQQEVPPFLLGSSDSENCSQKNPDSHQTSERPETSSAASISEALPTDIQEKLDDESFNPFQHVLDED